MARRLDPAQRAGQIADACDMAERRRIERVEADVDAADAGRRQHRRMFGEPHRVGGQRELVETVADQRAEAPGEGIAAAPHERLAAGQAGTAAARRGESLGKYRTEESRWGQESAVRVE